MSSQIKTIYGFADLNKLNDVEWSNSVVFSSIPKSFNGIGVKKAILTVDNDKTQEFEGMMIQGDGIKSSISHNLYQFIITYNTLLSCAPKDMNFKINVVLENDTVVYEDNSILLKKAVGPKLFNDSQMFSHVEIVRMGPSEIMSNTVVAFQTNIRKEDVKNIKTIFHYQLKENIDDNSSPWKQEVLTYEPNINISCDESISIENYPIIYYKSSVSLSGITNNSKYLEYYVEVLNNDSPLCVDNVFGHNYTREINQMPDLKDLFKFDNNMPELSSLFSGLGGQESEGDGDAHGADAQIDMKKMLDVLKLFMDGMKEDKKH